MSFIHNPKQLARQVQFELIHPAILVMLGIKYDSGYIDADVLNRIEYAQRVTSEASDKSLFLVKSDWDNPECYRLELLD